MPAAAAAAAMLPAAASGSREQLKRAAEDERPQARRQRRRPQTSRRADAAGVQTCFPPRLCWAVVSTWARHMPCPASKLPNVSLLLDPLLLPGITTGGKSECSSSDLKPVLVALQVPRSPSSATAMCPCSHLQRYAILHFIQLRIFVPQPLAANGDTTGSRAVLHLREIVPRSCLIEVWLSVDRPRPGGGIAWQHHPPASLPGTCLCTMRRSASTMPSPRSTHIYKALSSSTRYAVRMCCWNTLQLSSTSFVTRHAMLLIQARSCMF